MKRKNLQDILVNYQVAADEQIVYRPKILGANIPIDKLDSLNVGMTKTEGALLDQLIRDRSPSELISFTRIRLFAEVESKNRYPPTGTPPAELSSRDQNFWHFNDGHADAFRHACWNALLTKRYGEKWADAFASAHEGGPNNPGTREAMDLYNNEVGRKIGATYPDASYEELAARVQEAADRGELVVIDKNGQLTWSDNIRVGEHGMAKDGPREPLNPAPKVPEEELKEKPWNSLSQRPMNETDTPMHIQKMYAENIYLSCSKGVDALDAQMGRTSDQASACMKASLANLAARNGLDHVDHVLLSQQAPGVAAGQYVFVVQGDPGNPAHLRAHMPTEQAVKTSEESSLKELSLAMASRTPQQSEELQQHQQHQQRDVLLRGA